MGYISRGQTVTVTEKGDSWCKITYNGKTGYVSTQYLSFASSGNTGSDTATPSTTYPYDAYCTASSLNIRSGAGTGYPCIGGIPYGAQMSVVGEAGDGWLKITYGGITGCVSAQYVSTTKPSSSGGNNSTSGGGSGYDYTPPEGLTGTAAENIIAIATSQIGYQEGHNNDTKYGIAFGMNHQPWCHMFVWWCARQAGISSSVIPATAHCPSGLNWFRSYAIYHARGDGYTPQPGDIIYFTWRSGSVSHVGIVEKVVGNTVYTIEGNTERQGRPPQLQSLQFDDRRLRRPRLQLVTKKTKAERSKSPFRFLIVVFSKTKRLTYRPFFDQSVFKFRFQRFGLLFQRFGFFFDRLFLACQHFFFFLDRLFFLLHDRDVIEHILKLCAERGKIRRAQQRLFVLFRLRQSLAARFARKFVDPCDLFFGKHERPSPPRRFCHFQFLYKRLILHAPRISFFMAGII